MAWPRRLAPAPSYQRAVAGISPTLNAKQEQDQSELPPAQNEK